MKRSKDQVILVQNRKILIISYLRRTSYLRLTEKYSDSNRKKKLSNTRSPNPDTVIIEANSESRTIVIVEGTEYGEL